MEALNDTPSLPLVVEVLDHHGRVQQRERIVLDAAHPSFTVGRSARADVMLDDEHAAALHAEISVNADGDAHVTDLGSVNGIVVGGKRHRAASGLLLPELALQVGRTRLRLRLPGETLAPEREDRAMLGHLSPRHAPRLALAGGLLCLLFVFYSVWLEAPTDLVMPLVIGIVTTVLMLGVWSAIWSLLTRVMQGEWRWLSHAAIFLGVMAGLYVLDGVLEIVWFSLDLPFSAGRELLLLVLAAMLAIYAHLAVAAAIRPASAVLAAVIVPLLVAVPSVWMIERSHDRDVNYIAEPEPIFPAALRLRSSHGLDEFFASAQGLQARSDARSKQLEDDEADDGED